MCFISDRGNDNWLIRFDRPEVQEEDVSMTAINSLNIRCLDYKWQKQNIIHDGLASCILIIMANSIVMFDIRKGWYKKNITPMGPQLNMDKL